MADRSSVLRVFGENVRRERERAGLTQEQLAAAAGLHRTHVGLLERGLRDPRLPTIVRLCRGLGVDAGTLLDGL